MSQKQGMREFELKCIIENIELDLEFQDFTKEEEAEKKAELNQAKVELKTLQTQK
ncbi:hypothetical protein [Staphylococcus capitis]|uniref:Phage protein n=1 Tax=Staphylococcus capitis TaxID=29388 RepID=A0ABX1SUT5_STACP|nr:hypothetical protein [Staphylococcus capitis]NMK54668.1 hypothetical protein [Staphylococcus capitis]NMK69902.1 hypothetical protein [Staphylococcus capitis]